MQVHPKPQVEALIDRLIDWALPGRRGLEAWVALLRTQATLMRRLEADLEKEIREVAASLSPRRADAYVASPEVAGALDPALKGSASSGDDRHALRIRAHLNARNF